MNTIGVQDLSFHLLSARKGVLHISSGFWQFLLFSGVLFCFQPAEISYYDESIILTGSLQWLHGNLPAVDYYTVYGPLQFFVISQLLKFTDNSFMIARLVYAFTLAIPVVILAGLIPGKAIVGKHLRFSYISAMVLFCTWFASAFYPSHSLPLLFSMLLLVKLKLDDNCGLLIRTVILALMLTGVFLLRPTIGITLAVGLFFAIPFNAFNKSQLNRTQLKRDGLTLVLAVFIACLLILVVEFRTHGVISSTLDILLSIQSEIYPQMRALPFPSLFANEDYIKNIGVLLAAYVPLVCLAGGIGCYGLFLFGRLSLTTREAQLLFWLLFFATLLYSLGLVRTDNAHLLAAMIFSLPIGCQVCLIALQHTHHKLVKSAFSGFILSLAGMSIFIAVMAFLSPAHAERPSLLFSCLSTRMEHLSDQGCLTVDEDMQAALPALKRILHPGEKIFSANSRHDKIFINNLSYYSASGHMPIGYWAHMDPGVQTSATIQQEIIGELNSHAHASGRSIVIVAKTFLKNEPNSSANSSGVTLLDTYLANCPEVFAHNSTRILECTEQTDRNR